MASSARLTNALKGLGKLDDATLTTFVRDVRNGTSGWFPAEFHDTVYTGLLTPQTWAALVDSGRSLADAKAPAREARQLWAAVSPGSEFPADEDGATDGMRWSVAGQ
jgi:hypothetical protein